MKKVILHVIDAIIIFFIPVLIVGIIEDIKTFCNNKTEIITIVDFIASILALSYLTTMKIIYIKRAIKNGKQKTKLDK